MILQVDAARALWESLGAWLDGCGHRHEGQSNKAHAYLTFLEICVRVQGG